MRRIMITDEITGQQAEVDYMDVADVLDSWNPDAPAEVLDAIDGLQEAINRHQPIGDFTTYLAIRVVTA